MRNPFEYGGVVSGEAFCNRDKETSDLVRAMDNGEFKLLEFFLRHKEQVVTRTMLLEGVWDYRYDPHTNIIDTHISRLRKKIEDGFDGPILHTVRGVGYRLSRQT